MQSANKPLLLLVDDNPDACRTAAQLISWSGDYETDIAADGPAALELCAEKSYALAIIDYQMPGMNGLELFRRMRDMRPDIKAIFVTGFAQLDVVFPAIEAGVLRVLAKPVDFEELIPVIDEYAGVPL
jgi:two-component system, NtrC family, response regulator HydG